MHKVEVVAGGFDELGDVISGGKRGRGGCGEGAEGVEGTFGFAHGGGMGCRVLM